MVEGGDADAEATDLAGGHTETGVLRIETRGGKKRGGARKDLRHSGINTW